MESNILRDSFNTQVKCLTFEHKENYLMLQEINSSHDNM